MSNVQIYVFCISGVKISETGREYFIDVNNPFKHNSPRQYPYIYNFISVIFSSIFKNVVTVIVLENDIGYSNFDWGYLSSFK